MKHKGNVVVTLLVCSILSSCSPKQKVTDQVTPQACLAKWHRAAVEGELARFRQCFYCPTKEHEEAVGAMFEYAKVAMELGREIETRFGAKDWDDFRKANGGQGFAPIVPPWKYTEEWSTTRVVKVQDGNAEVVLFHSHLPGPDHTDRMTRRDGEWFLDAETMLQNPKDAAAFFAELKGTMAKAMEACKKPEATIDSVKASM